MVTPIAATLVNWDEWLTQARSLLNRSVTEKLDQHRRQVRNLPGFVSTLAEAAELPEGLMLRHASASFLVDMQDNYISENTGLTCSSLVGRKPCMVLTGSLASWRDAIVAMCQESVPFEIRDKFNEIYEWFESTGFAFLWSEYSKKSRSDQTFLLSMKQ